ncbi:MAG: hypothetical protein ACI9T7_003230 [Oleiphilaceae bacterium]|jgi:hypothetical protein
MSSTKVIDGTTYHRFGVETGRAVYVQEGIALKQMQELEKQRDTSFHHRYTYNQVKTLCNPISGYNSKEQTNFKGENQVCEMDIAGSKLAYFKSKGATYIKYLLISGGGYDDARNKRIMTGLYKAKQNEENIWEVNKPINTVETTHAAVNGDAYRIEEMLQFMPTMIKKGHDSAGAEIANEGFSLFYSPCEKGTDDGWRAMTSSLPQGKEHKQAARKAIIDRLSASIEITKDQKVKWTVQGTGSTLFCEALTQLKQRNPQGIDLSRHSAYFFNPHTSPVTISKVIKQCRVSEGSDGLYTSAGRSRGNLNAMADGHKSYSKAKIAQTLAEDPNMPVADKRNDSKSMQHQAITATDMTVKITKVITVGAFTATCFTNKAIQDGVLDALQTPTGLVTAAGLTLVGGLYGTSKLAVKTGPKYIALAQLGKAAVAGDHRLDQLTEFEAIKGATQLKKLKLGYSI